MRILLSEGSSTSAREAITALGLKGHDVEICDPDPYCLGRFSRFVRKFHRCPGLRDDPKRYLAFVEALLTCKHFDVLIPIHEQGFVFAAAPRRLAARVGLALPSFASYRMAVSKSAFSRLLDELALPQPHTRVARSAQELQHLAAGPCVLKTVFGTASRGTRIVRTQSDVTRAMMELRAAEAFALDQEILVQELVAGSVERAQAVFRGGQLIAMHAYRQVLPGAGGGDAAKESVHRPMVRTHLARIGERLAWHGALSVDYILPAQSDDPRYIDCNPRLVEPMSAFRAGLDLVELLVQVSLGETPNGASEGRVGVRTHLGMQALLGCGLRSGTRGELLREFVRLVMGKDCYADSKEELTPVDLDWLSAVPLLMTELTLLLRPDWSRTLPERLFGAHLLNLRSAMLIEREIAARCWN
jgi:predicted ATP-grasp superfamily ATP-dependent carboligase